MVVKLSHNSQKDDTLRCFLILQAMVDESSCHPVVPSLQYTDIFLFNAGPTYKVRAAVLPRDLQ